MSSDSDDGLPAVEPVGVDEIDPTAFEGLETSFPYAVLHAHRVANGVRDEPPNRGYFDVHVWRSARVNEPYNARIMESILTLVYFYTRDRDWNPYRGDPALRARLEAAIEYWLSLQHEDGRFPEYGEGDWNLPATAFATKFFGQALVYLESEDPSIDPDLHDRVKRAVRDALDVTFTREDLQDHGAYFSNQYSNAFAGAGAYLSLYDDPEIADLLADRLEWSLDALQSTAGFFHEKDAPDWSYNLGTHQSNLTQAHHYLEDTDLCDLLVEKERRWEDWVAYNAVLEPAATSDAPDGGFFLNCAADVRNTTRHRQGSGNPLGQYLDAGGAFHPSREERDEWIERLGDTVATRFPILDELLGRYDGLNPYTFLHLDHESWYPTATERRTAREALPYLASDRFVHQHVCDRTGLVVSHVRRPGYYAIVNAAAEALDNQRFGLGILWHPDAGTALQSRKDIAHTAYGTRTGPDERAYEADGLDVTYTIAGDSIDPTPGSVELSGNTTDPFAVSYPLGDRGTKSISFTDDGVAVTVAHAGRFVESIPLLSGPEPPTFAGDTVAVEYEDTTLSVTAADAEEVFCFATPRRFEAEARHWQSNWPTVDRPFAVDKRLHVARVYATDDLTYRLSFD